MNKSVGAEQAKQKIYHDITVKVVNIALVKMCRHATFIQVLAGLPM